MINENLDPRFINDLYLFYQLFVAYEMYGDDFKPANHIKELSRHLMALKLGRLDKHLAVSMPPRHSKSSMITLAYPLWLIFQNHDLDILIVSNGKELVETFGIDLRELIKKHGPRFNVYLSDVKHSSTHLKLCDSKGNLYNGSIRLTGASGSITGQNADYLIVDDPYKGEDDELTPSALQKKINWFLRIIIQRIEPKTRLLVLHTRWHSQDLIGYFDEELKEDFRFITYPAILDDNTPLWPEQYTIEDLEKKRETIKERLFSSIYQQKPLDETSDFFNLSKIKYEGLHEDEYVIKTIRTWDISKGATLQSDFTAGCEMVLTNHNRIGVTDIVHGQFDHETKNQVLITAHSDGFNVEILIETGVAAAGDLLFDEWELQLPGHRVHRSKAITSKPDRATPLKNGITDEDFFIDINNSQLLEKVNKEFASFPDGIHDDIVDAIAYGYIFLHNFLREEEDQTFGIIA